MFFHIIHEVQVAEPAYHILGLGCDDVCIGTLHDFKISLLGMESKSGVTWIRWDMNWMTRILTSSYVNFKWSWYKFFTFCNLYYTCSLYGIKLFAKVWRFLVVKVFKLCTCCFICKASKHNINPLRFKFPSHFPSIDLKLFFLFLELKLLYMLYEWWFVVYLGGFGWPICK